MVLFVICMAPREVFAATCEAGLSGAYTTSDSCSFSGSVNGVDTVLTVKAGTTLTIQPDQTIGATTIVIQTGGSIILPANGSGSMKPGAKVWYKDADGDHYPADPDIDTPKLQTDSPGAGWAAKNTLIATTKDCYDSGANAANAFPDQPTFQAAPRGDGSWDYDCSGDPNPITYQYEMCVCQTCVEGCPSSPVCTLYQTNSGYTCGSTMTPGPGACSRVNDGYGTCTECNNGADGSYVVLCK